MVRKVLVQWLPSPALRAVLGLTHGARGANEIAVRPVHVYEPEFAALFTRANQWLEGLPIVQCGFDAKVRATDVGWQVTAWTDKPAPNEAYFHEVPTTAELLAKDQQINPHRQVPQEAIDRVAETARKHLALEAEANERAREELLAAHKALAENPEAIQTTTIGKSPEPVVEKAVAYGKP